MESFLHKVAKNIISKELYGPNSVIVLPNRRSEVYLKNEIKKISDSSIWLPEFYPVDRFVQRLSGLTMADQISLSLHLYTIHKRIEKNNTRPVDEFLSWAPLMISDFNDIDNALADPQKVYKDLSAIKEMEHWDPGRNPLTNLQKAYLRFYKSMIVYYQYLHEIMLNENSGYSGFINKQLAQNIESFEIPWENILIAGLNAFSEAEIQIFDHLNKNYNTSFLWDIDSYYMHNTSSGVTNEAGSYINYIIKRLKLDLPEDIPDYISETKKNIRLLSSQKNISQVKFIGQEIELLSKDEFDKTAIILGNENLIVPLIHSLPTGNDFKYNITLGYPLVNSQSEFFILDLIDILDQGLRNKEISNKSLIRFFKNVVTKSVIGHAYSEGIITKLMASGFSCITEELLHKIIHSEEEIKPLLKIIFDKDGKALIYNSLEKVSQLLTQSVSKITSENMLFMEEFKTMILIVSKLLAYIKFEENDFTFASIRKIIHQLFSQSKVDIIGQPLEGIQIMGMLESRALDFKNIYFLSVNEGMIPKTNSFDSFIPFDLRRKNNLPMPAYKTGIYAYHFFRLFQRSENVNLIYSNSLDDFGGGEKSRFILQLEDEIAVVNNNITIEKKVITTQTPTKESVNGSHLLTINKNEAILKTIKSTRSKGYSATRLTTYLTCSLKYYFSYILKLKPEVLPDQAIEANVFGTAVHGVLERVYKKFEKKEIDTNLVGSEIGKVKAMLVKEFHKQIPTLNLESGKNMLLFEVANTHINNFLKWDVRNLTDNPSILVSAEKKHELLLPNSDNLKVTGIIDRIDKVLRHDNLRVIDYKTGNVEPKDLKVKDIGDLFINPDKSKAFQLMFYQLLLKNDIKNNDIECGIISTRNISRGFMPLSIEDEYSKEDRQKIFIDLIIKLVEEIENYEIPFTRTGDISRCEFCNFKDICNR